MSSFAVINTPANRNAIAPVKRAAPTKTVTTYVPGLPGYTSISTGGLGETIYIGVPESVVTSTKYLQTASAYTTTLHAGKPTETIVLGIPVVTETTYTTLTSGRGFTSETNLGATEIVLIGVAPTTIKTFTYITDTKK